MSTHAVRATRRRLAAWWVLLALVSGGAPATGQTVPREAQDSATAFRREAVAAPEAGRRLSERFRLSTTTAAMALLQGGYGAAEVAGRAAPADLNRLLLAVMLETQADAERNGERIDGNQTRKEQLRALMAIIGSEYRGRTRQLFTAFSAIQGTTTVIIGELLEVAEFSVSEVFVAALAAGKTATEATQAVLGRLLALDPATQLTQLTAMLEALTADKNEAIESIMVMLTVYHTTQQRLLLAKGALAAGLAPDAPVAAFRAVGLTIGTTIQVMTAAGWTLAVIATGFDGNSVSAQDFVTGWTGVAGSSKTTADAIKVAKAVAQSDYAVATVASMVTLLKAAGYGATAIAGGVAGALTVTATQLASGLIAAGYSTLTVARALADGTAAGAAAVTTALIGAGASAGVVASALKEVFALTALSVAMKLKNAGLTQSEVFAALANSFALNSAETQDIIALWMS
jgi:hypothetical protein